MIQIADKFEPLFELLDDNAHPDVDTVILTGGRASSKSFTVAVLSLIGLVEKNWKILYSRFTNISIGDSIKEEVSSKIDLLNYQSKLIDNKYSIERLDGVSYISFKGIKTGSKGQTANLKSLSGFNLFVVDEAEEIPSYEVFKKVFYSIRSVDKRNLSILILNPTVKTHWIYKTFFSKSNVPDGFCGVIDNVLYIHSSYLDVNPDYIPENIVKDYERLKEDDPEEYRNVVMGGWIKQLEGCLFPDSDLNYYTELPKDKELVAKLAFVDVADAGDDNHSVPFCNLYDDGSIYINDVVFTKLPMSNNVLMTSDKINHNKPEYVRVETNFGGSAYIMALEPHIKSNTQLLSVKATTNKHARILNSQYTIKRNVYFKHKSIQDSEYTLFMDNIYEYMSDGSSDHDDAPDSLEGLIQLCKSMYRHLFEN